MLLKDVTKRPSSSFFPCSGIVFLKLPLDISFVAAANWERGSENLLLITKEMATADNIANINTKVKVKV